MEDRWIDRRPRMADSACVRARLRACVFMCACVRARRRVTVRVRACVSSCVRDCFIRTQALSCERAQIDGDR